MHDAAKVITGLLIFLVLITFPIWFTLASGKADYEPDLQVPAEEKNCVESREFMNAWHMDLLNDWRDAVVRDGQRIYIPEQEIACSSDSDCTGGTCVEGLCRFRMSLSLNCMKCHTDKSKFCDQCHNYIGIDPYCWDCHVEPKGE